ncbi:FMN-dependent dehydrogenase [Blastococcus mobilis]|uniref:FMN-dependent dehydrogenase n=1 Tax=Blastococcus mobilis TaxID=1938746 RepID=A0A238UTM3_9ACTN|nr:FMN-dependent dehydrogenase [Blastococcus mobilis]
MTDKVPLGPVRTARRAPKWSELRDVVQFRRPRFGRTARRLTGALTVRDLRAAAQRTTPRAVFHYVDGAAEEEITAARNLAAYRRVTFHPDALRSVADPDTSVELSARGSRCPWCSLPPATPG